MRSCSIEGCAKPHCAKGLCNSHWATQYYGLNKELKRQQKRDWESRNKDLVRQQKRRSHYKAAFGISLEEYAAMLEVQGGRCKLCQSDNPKSKRKTGLQVDHDHKTGKIRGLLCVPCNLALGHLQDSPELMRKAAAYVEGC